MTRTETPWGPWEPATPAEAAELFAGLGAHWWIAGGYAVEFAVGRPLREHADIDILLLRPDHLAAQQALAGWEWWAADPPGTLRPWLPGERLPAAVTDVWCRPAADAPWRLQLMIDETDEEGWVSRRNPGLRRPVAELGGHSADGIPFLRPEIQFLYKAAHVRPKDQLDFDAALPHLSPDQRGWLDRALAATYGPHPWSERLRAAQGRQRSGGQRDPD